MCIALCKRRGILRPLVVFGKSRVIRFLLHVKSVHLAGETRFSFLIFLEVSIEGDTLRNQCVEFGFGRLTKQRRNYRQHEYHKYGCATLHKFSPVPDFTVWSLADVTPVFACRAVRHTFAEDRLPVSVEGAVLR